MKASEIIVGHRVLIQSGAETKEVAVVKGIVDKNTIAVQLTDYRIIEIEPQYIIKSFGC